MDRCSINGTSKLNRDPASLLQFLGSFIPILLSDRDEETFFNLLYQLDISAEHANEIKDYYIKYVNGNSKY